MRQQTNFDPSVKHFEAYLNFSGGMNTEVANERLNENEFIVLQNVDNSGRGSAKIRSGRKEIDSPITKNYLTSANGQGLFNFHTSSGSSQRIIAAAGRLYTIDPSGQCLPIPIVDGGNPDFTFQTTKIIEAAQYKDDLYVATGTKIVQVYAEGATLKAKTITPYRPTAMEAIYIGTNALADNPDAYIEDSVSADANFSVVGIKPATRKGAVNVPIDLTTFIARPSGNADVITYKWEHKRSSDTGTTWTLVSDFDANGKIRKISFPSATNYDVRVTLRKNGETADLATYTLSSFEISATAEPPSFTVDRINTCRKIMMHWDRLMLAGDDSKPYQMYISDVLNPLYFPVSNTISFDFGKQEPITSIVRFQDILVVFTPTMIQTLIGKSTEDYARFLINDGIGCIAERSAQVVGNTVLFLSAEGVQSLRPNPFRLETMNVQRVDQQLQASLQPYDKDACAIFKDAQYWLCYPSRKEIYRYYFERKVWVVDKSDKLDIVEFLKAGDDVFNLTKGGRVYQHDKDLTTDAGAPYRMTIQSKFYDLGASFNNKKLKKLYILARHYRAHDIKLFVTVKADSTVALTPDSGVITDKGNGLEWEFISTPNFEFIGGTSFGKWIMGLHPFGSKELSVQQAAILGKCRRVQITIEADSGNEMEIFGFAFQFKLKKV